MTPKSQYTEQDYLNAIDRTRLLFNTHDSLCEAMCYSTKTKHIGTIGGKNLILKKAMLAYLDAQYAKDVSPEIDLISLLEDYIQASEYVSKFHRQKYFIDNKEKIKDNFAPFIEYFCVGNTDCRDKQVLADLETMENEGVGLYNYTLPIMLLILWGVIPTFNTKTICDVEDIRGDGEQMFGIIEAVIKSSKVLRRFPVIDRYRKEFEDCIAKAGEISEVGEEQTDFTGLPNRLRLIHSLSAILAVLYNNSSPETMIDTFDSIRFGCIDICGYWEDVKINGKGRNVDLPTLWYFESEDNSIYNVKQVLQNEDGERTVYYRTYEMYVMDSGHLLFIPKQAVEKILETGKLPNDMQFMMTIDSRLENGVPVEIVLTCCSDNKWFESRTMRRITRNADCKKLFNSLRSCPQDFDYEFVDYAFAITEEHIYFSIPDTDLFYKVPRTEHFENTDIYDLIMCKTKDCIFIGCPKTLKYIDVTDDTKLESKGISIVKCIRKTER
jgi:hypothetical protein